MDYISHYDSPLGKISFASDGEALTKLWFHGQKYFCDTVTGEYINKDLPVFALTRKWLDIYFKGGIPDFTPPLKLHSTPFREEVWEILLSIPYAKTMTYGDIAKAIAKRRRKEKMSPQAVGGAVGHNPISIIIPCHRVIGAGGKLTGYAAGTEVKAALLELEAAARTKERK